MSESTPAYLYPQDVAEILGVGVSTVKRMVNKGRLPARVTTGRHRRIEPGDVLRLVHSGNYPCARPELLARFTRRECSASQLREQFEEALRKGDSVCARTLLVDSYDSGLSVAHLGDEVIAPSMTQIGHDWEVGDLDVYEEHRATQTCLAALLALRSRVEKPVVAARQVAAGGGPEGDPSMLANALVELVFTELGWEAINVGANTPFASFERLLDETRPAVLWLSCSHLPDEANFLAGLGRLQRKARTLGVRIAVGGYALPADLRTTTPVDHRGGTLVALTEFARSLA